MLTTWHQPWTGKYKQIFIFDKPEHGSLKNIIEFTRASMLS